MSEKLQRRIGIHVLAVLLVGSLAAAAPARGSSTRDDGAWIQPELLAAFDTPDARFVDAIITMRDHDDLALLAGLAAPHAALQQLPIARAFLSLDEVQDLARWPQVRSIVANERHEWQDREVDRVTHVDAVHTRSPVAFQGTGVRIAVIDSGVDGTHPDLEDRIERNWRMIDHTCLGGTPSEVGWTSPCSLPASGSVAVSGTRDGIDLSVSVSGEYVTGQAFVGKRPGAGLYNDAQLHPLAGIQHGTPVIGSIVGTGRASGGTIRGTAPDARVHSYGVGAANTMFMFIAAYDHILDSNERAPQPERIRIVNNSFGVPDCGPEPGPGENGRYRILEHPLHVASWEAYRSGVLSVFAYGNEGSTAAEATCLRYSVAPWALAVGATTRAADVTWWTSTGRSDGNHDRAAALANIPCYYGEVECEGSPHPVALFRPGVVAPGEDVLTTGPAWSNNVDPWLWAVSPNAPDPMVYRRAGGTSFSAPITAGIAALVIQAYESTHPGLVLQPMDVIRILEGTATAEDQVRVHGTEANGYRLEGVPVHARGAGLVDASAAVTSAVEGVIPGAPRLEAKVKASHQFAMSRRSGTVGSLSAWRDVAGEVGSAWIAIDVPKHTDELCVEVIRADDQDTLVIDLYRGAETGEDFVVRSDSASRFPTPTWFYSCLDTSGTGDGFVRLPRPEAGTWVVRVESTGARDTTPSFELVWRIARSTGKPVQP